MPTMYVISNETNEIVATITSTEGSPGRNENKKFIDAFEDRFGSNDYSNSFTDFGLIYADGFEEIEID